MSHLFFPSLSIHRTTTPHHLPSIMIHLLLLPPCSFPPSCLTTTVSQVQLSVTSTLHYVTSITPSPFFFPPSPSSPPVHRHHHHQSSVISQQSVTTPSIMLHLIEPFSFPFLQSLHPPRHSAPHTLHYVTPTSSSSFTFPPSHPPPKSTITIHYVTSVSHVFSLSSSPSRLSSTHPIPTHHHHHHHYVTSNHPMSFPSIHTSSPP